MCVCSLSRLIGLNVEACADDLRVPLSSRVQNDPSDPHGGARIFLFCCVRSCVVHIFARARIYSCTTSRVTRFSMQFACATLINIPLDCEIREKILYRTPLFLYHQRIFNCMYNRQFSARSTYFLRYCILGKYEFTHTHTRTHSV